MKLSLAYLGPTGTNSETVALAYANWLSQNDQPEVVLSPYPTIALAAKAVANQEVDLAVVPVENSIEGSVAITLDTLWQLEQLKIIQSLVLPISHALLSCSLSWQEIKTVYSHPQALGQCQQWLEQFLPSVKLIPTNSTTEALQYLRDDLTAAAIASPRAAKLYNIPILADHINDYPDNCTRFWVLSLNPTTKGSYLSLAFSLPENAPGALVKPLQIFARQGINLSKIESRPTKRSLGEYIFFIDIERNICNASLQTVLSELSEYTEVLKIFGNYDLLTVQL
ncbi:Prephenate dehydratase [Stanieria cyanosphaera PCC 7437]|uniref:Prephenate dehydratase n=1 Tax=Stanieria cyanosphaera (strain ATCC 29371 / PCC 7437) TaxID=111780 RepID=K9XT94_STAC7|nr:prephenate dehydratase [Stanieria cyanosphaera]AFZ35825.1 Prephenate dehydratase [Stanieria cyanosphaera PCC 7437]